MCVGGLQVPGSYCPKKSPNGPTSGFHWFPPPGSPLPSAGLICYSGPGTQRRVPGRSGRGVGRRQGCWKFLLLGLKLLSPSPALSPLPMLWSLLTTLPSPTLSSETPSLACPPSCPCSAMDSYWTPPAPQAGLQLLLSPQGMHHFKGAFWVTPVPSALCPLPHFPESPRFLQTCSRALEPPTPSIEQGGTVPSGAFGNNG